MAYYLLKIVVSAVVIASVAELAKRHTGIAALVASLPLTSLLAFIWLKIDAVPEEQIADLSIQIFWLVIPSLVLFVSLWMLLRHDQPFWQSLVLSCGATIIVYFAVLPLLRKLGVQL